MNDLSGHDDRSYKGSMRLLRSYWKKTAILGKAYKYQEGYWRSVYKRLTYPIIVISACSGVAAMFHNMPIHVLASLSFSITVLSGFGQAINPKDKEKNCNQVATEFNEISQNILQFITENNKSKDELKVYSNQCLALIEVWEGLSPPVKDKFMKEAKIHCTERHNRLVSDRRGIDPDALV